MIVVDDIYRTGTILNCCTFFLAFGFANLAMIIIMIVKIISMNMIVMMMMMIKVTMMVLTIMIIMTLVTVKKNLFAGCVTLLFVCYCALLFHHLELKIQYQQFLS